MQTSTQRGMQTMEHGLTGSSRKDQSSLLERSGSRLLSRFGERAPARRGLARSTQGAAGSTEVGRDRLASRTREFVPSRRRRRPRPGDAGRPLRPSRIRAGLAGPVAAAERSPRWTCAGPSAEAATPARLRPPQCGRRPRAAKETKDKRAKKLIGLKIGASQIAAARVVNNGAPELVEAVREPLEPGVWSRARSATRTALAAALTRFFELHKLPKRGVRLGLSNNRIGVRVFEIEGVADPRQLENAIRFRAEEVLPIPLDEAVLDYVVLDDETREDGTAVQRILLVVAYREVVDRYLQACRGAGLEVVGIDLEAFALLRSLAAPGDRSPGGGALVAVAVGYDRTTIAVSTGKTTASSRASSTGAGGRSTSRSRASSTRRRARSSRSSASSRSRSRPRSRGSRAGAEPRRLTRPSARSRRVRARARRLAALLPGSAGRARDRRDRAHRRNGAHGRAFPRRSGGSSASRSGSVIPSGA